MAKLTLLDLANLAGQPDTAQGAINSNNTLIEAALENTLSRDGTSPNSMQADLDMNSNDILNCGDIEAEDITCTSIEASNYTQGGVSLTALLLDWEGQWVTSTTYQVGDLVSDGGSSYICILLHQAASTSRPGVGVSWQTYWDLVASKGDPGVPAVSSGDVVGPASSVNDRLAAFNGVTGKLIKDSGITIANVLTEAEAAGLYQPLDSDLTALANNSTNGLWARTGSGTGSPRTITGTAAQLTVTDGDGVANNPILSFPSDVLIPTVLTVPNAGLHLLDTNASHDLIVSPGSDLTADRTLTLTTGDANRTLTVSANATVSQDYSTTGNPQFATIELGAATDTTLSRSAAGVLAVEGVVIPSISSTSTLTNKTIDLASNTLTGTLAQFNTALTGADFVSLAGVETLTNKTIDLASNTLTGTVAQFNTALTGADFATLAGTETLTGKTIDLASNTVTGTLAQFNTALTGADFVSLAGTETLTSKTIALGSNTVSGTTAQFNTALTDNDFATLAGTETLTTKTIALGSNTISGTTAQFNTALTDNDFATLAGTETLTNKTVDLTSNTLTGTVTQFNTALSGADFYTTGGTDVSLADGGTGASLVDPNVDRILFWDDSANTVTWLEVGTGLTITGTILTATQNVGTATINFGAFPGASDASVNVTGQTNIVAGSTVNAWIRPIATSDHSADEHLVETLNVVAGNIVAGTGFTIYGINTNQINDPGGRDPRIYGQWSVSWSWS